MYFDSWVQLGEFAFDGSAVERVQLVDITGEPQYSHRIAFDAVRWDWVSQ